MSRTHSTRERYVAHVERYPDGTYEASVIDTHSATREGLATLVSGFTDAYSALQYARDYIASIESHKVAEATERRERTVAANIAARDAAQTEREWTAIKARKVSQGHVISRLAAVRRLTARHTEQALRFPAAVVPLALYIARNVRAVMRGGLLSSYDTSSHSPA